MWMFIGTVFPPSVLLLVLIFGILHVFLCLYVSRIAPSRAHTFIRINPGGTTATYNERCLACVVAYPGTYVSCLLI